MKLALLLVLAASLGTVENANLIEDFFNKAFNQIRPQLKNLYQEKVQISNLTLINLFVDGLDEFYPTKLDVGLLPLKLKNCTIAVDDVKARSRYRMEDMIVPGPIVLYGAGDLSLNVTGASLSIQATLNVLNKVMTIKDIEDIHLNAQRIQIELTGLVGGGPVGELLSSILNTVATPIFNLMASPTLLKNKATLIPMINNVLSQIKV